MNFRSNFVHFWKWKLLDELRRFYVGFACEVPTSGRNFCSIEVKKNTVYVDSLSQSKLS